MVVRDTNRRSSTVVMLSQQVLLIRSFDSHQGMADAVATTANLRYTFGMETVIHNMRDLSDGERSAAEQLVGHTLSDDHQLIIQVVVGNGVTDQPTQVGDTLPDWCNVYEGLTDVEIAEIEKSIVRSDSTRFAN